MYRPNWVQLKHWSTGGLQSGQSLGMANILLRVRGSISAILLCSSASIIYILLVASVELGLGLGAGVVLFVIGNQLKFDIGPRPIAVRPRYNDVHHLLPSIWVPDDPG